MASWINILDILYPIGSIYFNISNTSPASIVGGSWTQLTDGLLACAGSAGYANSGVVGGSKKISNAQMPAHTHTMIQANWQNWASNDTGANNRFAVASGAPNGNPGLEIVSYSGNGTDYIPYHTSVYIWKRTA